MRIVSTMRHCEIVTAEDPPEFFPTMTEVEYEDYLAMKEFWPGCPYIAMVYVKLKSQAVTDLPLRVCARHAKLLNTGDVEWAEKMYS